MANIKAKKKNIKRIVVQTERNRAIKTTLKTLGKKVNAAITADDKEAAKTAAQQFMSALDKAAKRNVIHPNKASRHKANVAKYALA